MSAGDKIRAIADKLRLENEREKHLVKQIEERVGKMANNYDELVDEVVETVNRDLEASNN